MSFETITRSGWQLFSFSKPPNLNSDISKLYDAVASACESGMQRGAVIFPPDTFLSSRAIAVLIQCAELFRDHDGMLTVVCPCEEASRGLGMFVNQGVLNIIQDVAALGFGDEPAQS